MTKPARFEGKLVWHRAPYGKGMSEAEVITDAGTFLITRECRGKGNAWRRYEVTSPATGHGVSNIPCVDRAREVVMELAAKIRANALRLAP